MNPRICGKCYITDEGMAIVCEVHYSEYMNCEMQCELQTSKDNGLKIWELLKISPQ